MAAAIAPIISSVLPLLMGLFGKKSQATKDAEAMPAEFHQIMKDLMGDANMSQAQAEALWGEYQTQILDQSKDGYGAGPKDIMAYGDQVYQDEGQAKAAADETAKLQSQVDNGPNANTTWNDVSSILDQMGIGAGATYDAAEGVIRNNKGEVLGTIDDIQKKIQESTGKTFDAASGLQQKLYGELRTRMGAGFKDQRGQLGTYQTTADDAIAKAFSPDAVSARVGRSFAPAAASTAFRARMGGLSTMDPTYNSMAGKVDASRARAVDDALSIATGQNADRRLNVAGNVLNTGLGISRDEMGKDLSVSQADEAIQRGLILGRGEIDRNTIDTAGTRRITAINHANDQDINNIYRYQDKSNDVYVGRIAAATDKLTNSRADLATQAALADRRNTDREYMNNLRNQQFQAGMQFRTADLNRKDAGTAAVGNAANNAYARMMDQIKTGLAAGTSAATGFRQNEATANANSGAFTKIASSVAGQAGQAAVDYFTGKPKTQIPGSYDTVGGG